jgi:hypothetical protein
MNATEITTNYTEMIIKVSKLQNLYLSTMELLGKEHAATQLLWNEFVAADEVAQPWRVKMGQLSMRQQIDNGSIDIYDNNFRS